MAGQGGTPRKHQFDDEFMMMCYKIKLCPRLDHHNWKHCAFRHTGETAAQRRHPSCYKPTFCANLKMYGSCAAGDACAFSHNTFEMSLHPERYKTTLCNLGEKCSREICFFAHSTRDLRAPTPALAPSMALGDGTLMAAGGMPGASYVATGAGGGLQWAPAGAYGGGAVAVQQGMQVYAPVGMVTPSLAPVAPPGAVYLLPAGMQHAPQPGQQEALQQLLRDAEGQLGRSQGPPAPQQQQQQQQMMQAGAAQQLSGLMVQQLSLGESATTPSASPQAVLAATSGPPGYESSPVMALINSGGGTGGVSQSPLPPMLRAELQVAGGGGGSFTSQCSSSSHVSGAGVRSLPLTPWIDSQAGAGPPGLNTGGGGGGEEVLLACPGSLLPMHGVPMTLAPLAGAYSSTGGYETMQPGPGMRGGVELLSAPAAPGAVYQLVHLAQPQQQGQQQQGQQQLPVSMPHEAWRGGGQLQG